MKYVNKQNGKVMEILKRDEQKGTVLIRFEDGKSSSITTGTLKRWYKPIDDEAANPIVKETPENEQADAAVGNGDSEATYIAEVMDQKKELGIECPEIKGVEIVNDDTCADGSTYAEIGKGIANQAIAKATKVKETKSKTPKAKKARTPKEANADVPKIIEYIQDKVIALGAEVFAPEKAPKVRAFKIGGHMFARINISGKRVCLCCRSKAVSKQADQTQKHIFDAIFAFSDLSNTGLIDTLIQESFEYQNNKNTQKEDK